MNYKFFESLSSKEAQEYLDEFLLFGKTRAIEILEANLHFTTHIEFRVDLISSIFKELIGTVKTVPRDPDITLPEFIRRTPEYEKGLFDFDEASKSIILAAAYYLGEAFVRNYEQLSWATGNTDNAEGNMPVIVPFKHDIEMAPILITENLFRGVISEIRTRDSIDIAVEAWINNIPE
jgi:hypothetical protein